MAETELSAPGPATSSFNCHCSSCRHRQHCLPASMNREALDSLDPIVRHSPTLPAGHHLFRQGEAFKTLFMVHSGSIKTYRDLGDGRSQVLGFYLPGDLLGLEGMYPGRHCQSAAVLESSSVCRLSLRQLEMLPASANRIQLRLLDLASRELSNTMGRDLERCVESRMAEFLLDYGKRMADRGWSAVAYQLAMSRRDMGSYLGMAPETVSRCLRRLTHLGLVSFDRRAVTIHDPDRLRSVSVEGTAALH